MAGQGNEGDLWDRYYLGLNLLPTAMCSGFRTLSFTSVQNLGAEACSTNLALDEARSSRMVTVTHVSKKMFYTRESWRVEETTELRLGWVNRAV